MLVRRAVAAVVLVVSCVAVAAAQAPVSYRLSFPEPEHRWMQVEVTFSDVPAGPLQVRMSRTSPGRYALHEFSKNVFDVRVRDGKGKALTPARPDLHQWDVAGHDGTVVVTYRVFGDRIDGTYLSVDATHAHMNMPATLMWARGFETRPARVRFEQPPGRKWRVATQLYPTDDPLTFTAPNFHYLMDSPTEFSAYTLRTFTRAETRAAAARRRSASRCITTAPTPMPMPSPATPSGSSARRWPSSASSRTTRTTPTRFSPTTCRGRAATAWSIATARCCPAAGRCAIPRQRSGILGTVAHEFFHSWNMERIRAKDIEPFNFEEADVSGELWLGEGFTSYYDDLIMLRAGLTPLDQTLGSFAGAIKR